MKVYLSPSDQWSNIVAGGEHSEAFHCNKIAEYARAYLELNGYEVKIGSSVKENTYKNRVKESNEWGGFTYSYSYECWWQPWYTDVVLSYQTKQQTCYKHLQRSCKTYTHKR